MSEHRSIPCAYMRGGTSKGVVLLGQDLPADPDGRDHLLLRIMGSPDVRQVDGMGGAHPLTSKVAVVSPSSTTDADIDYLFLQVVVDQPVVSGSQTCGNMLAAVAPFAIERGLISAGLDVTDVRVRLVNTGSVARVRVQTPGGHATYEGDTAITGVPGTAAPVEIVTESAGAPVLPTGNAVDELGGMQVTCIDNGMPSVLIKASDVGIVGDEAPSDLESDDDLRGLVRRVRAGAAEAMGMSTDLDSTTVPKVVIVSEPHQGGTIATRSFIPDRVHEAIGVLGAASVAAAAQIVGTVAHDVAAVQSGVGLVRVEHPSGFFDVKVDVVDSNPPTVRSTTAIRTARMIMDGQVFPGPARPEAAESRSLRDANSAPHETTEVHA